MSMTESTRTKIVAIAATKGGVGKTTIAVNLAVELARRGQRVLFIDSDPGKDGLQFFKYRKAHTAMENLQTTYDYSAEIHLKLTEIAKKNKFDVIVVDSGGMDSMPQRLVLSVADIHYHPTMIGRADLGRIIALSKNEGYRKIRNNRPTYVIFSNCWNNHTKFFESFEAAAKKHFEAVETKFPRRIAFVEAWSEGKSAIEYHENDLTKAAASDLDQFVKEIQQHLKELD
jgi:chromosome partitioning protein